MRPQKKRIVAYNPTVSYFKPRGIPMLELDEMQLTIDAYEAVCLSDLEGMSHEEAGQAMGVSRATFGRIILKARKVIANAIVNGKAIKIEGGTYALVEDKRVFMCNACGHRWEAPLGTGKPKECPTCNVDTVVRVKLDKIR